MTEKRIVMLLSNVSPPLTVATEDYTMWFLKYEHYSGTSKSSLFTRNMADKAIARVD